MKRKFSSPIKEYESSAAETDFEPLEETWSSEGEEIIDVSMESYSADDEALNESYQPSVIEYNTDDEGSDVEVLELEDRYS